MDVPKDCHMEWSKTDREGDVSYDIIYIGNLKIMMQLKLLIKQKETQRLRR